MKLQVWLNLNPEEDLNSLRRLRSYILILLDTNTLVEIVYGKQRWFSEPPS